MKDLFRGPSAGWNGLAAVLLLVLVGIVIFDRLVPVTSSEVSAKARLANQRKLKDGTENAKKTEQQNEAYIKPLVWNEPADTIGPLALEQVNHFAHNEKLTVVAFRPQKPQDSGDLSRLSYLVALEGSFPNIVRFVRSVEQPATRLAVNLVQISSSDGDSDKVTATIGIVAVRRIPKVLPKPAKPSVAGAKHG